MKKITFILLALISGNAFAQTATADALTSANIVSPITINKATDFNFGQVTNEGGTVIIDTENTVTGTADLVGSIGRTAAAFTVNAADTYTYDVNLPTDITLTNQTGTGSESMKVTALEHDSTETGTGSDETFEVGGTLTVEASQVVGAYEGTLTVSVNYN